MQYVISESECVENQSSLKTTLILLINQNKKYKYEKIISITITMYSTLITSRAQSFINTDSLIKNTSDSNHTLISYGITCFINIEQLEKDTIPVIMLMSDTSKLISVNYIRGYEVREKKCCVDGNTSMYTVYQPVPYYIHLNYLDKYKCPIPDSWIIWGTK